MDKILVVCGPTATGKTRLALHLAKVFDGEIISADSRQVYKYMDVGTGKDLPSDSKFFEVKLKLTEKIESAGKIKIGYYKINNIKVWGYDLVEPQFGFSVFFYLRIIRIIIADIYKRKKLPILVGGTGFYIKALIDGIPTVNIPQNINLRDKISGKSAEELFEMIASIDPTKAASMNLSDKKNPRRLIRAIEVAQWEIDHTKIDKKNIIAKRFDAIFFGLKMSNKDMEKRIKERVNERLNWGFEDEVKKLKKMGVDPKMQSMNSIGYREWLLFLNNKITKNEALDRWTRKEIKYAKKQLVWFKKDPRIVWFDPQKSSFIESVELLVKKWYKK